MGNVFSSIMPPGLQDILDFFTKIVPKWWDETKQVFEMLGTVISHPLDIFNLFLSAIVGALGWLAIMIASIPGIDYVVFGMQWWCTTIVSVAWYGLLIMVSVMKASALSFWELIVRLVSGGSASSHFIDNINECHAPLGAWHAVPLDNTYDKVGFGCKLPCATGFFSSSKYDPFCRANPNWQPGLCPQQQIYRLFNKLSNVGTLATIHSPQPALLSSDQKQSVADQLTNIRNNLNFLTACKNNVIFARYNQYIKTICMHNKTIDNDAAASVCNAFYCLLDGSDPSGTSMCQKFSTDERTDVNTHESHTGPIIAVVICTSLVVATLIVVTMFRIRQKYIPRINN